MFQSWRNALVVRLAAKLAWHCWSCSSGSWKDNIHNLVIQNHSLLPLFKTRIFNRIFNFKDRPRSLIFSFLHFCICFTCTLFLTSNPTCFSLLTFSYILVSSSNFRNSPCQKALIDCAKIFFALSSQETKPKQHALQKKAFGQYFLSPSHWCQGDFTLMPWWYFTMILAWYGQIDIFVVYDFTVGSPLIWCTKVVCGGFLPWGLFTGKQ